MKAVRTGYGVVLAWVAAYWVVFAAGIALLALQHPPNYAVLALATGIAAAAAALGLPLLGVRVDPENRLLRIRQPNAFIDLHFDDIAVVEFPTERGVFAPGLAVIDASGRRFRTQLVREGVLVESSRLSRLRDVLQTAGVACGRRQRRGW